MVWQGKGDDAIYSASWRKDGMNEAKPSIGSTK